MEDPAQVCQHAWLTCCMGFAKGMAAQLPLMKSAANYEESVLKSEELANLFWLLDATWNHAFELAVQVAPIPLTSVGMHAQPIWPLEHLVKTYT